jgi:hypothetical protein
MIESIVRAGAGCVSGTWPEPKLNAAETARIGIGELTTLLIALIFTS